MQRQSGFTVIEVLVIVVFLLVAAVVGFVQFSSTRNSFDDSRKRTAINAIYYSLEEGFYKQHGYYPETIKDDTLKTMDKELLTDPNGIKIGEPGSTYSYEARSCSGGHCKEYTLRATLKNEADFTKDSQHK